MGKIKKLEKAIKVLSNITDDELNEAIGDTQDVWKAVQQIVSTISILTNLKEYKQIKSWPKRKHYKCLDVWICAVCRNIWPCEYPKLEVPASLEEPEYYTEVFKAVMHSDDPEMDKIMERGALVYEKFSNIKSIEYSQDNSTEPEMFIQTITYFKKPVENKED